MSDPFGDNPVVLSEAERDAIQAWVDARKVELALSDWAFTVTRHASEKGSLASSFVRDQADIATMAVAADWRDWPAGELRQSLTHELLHPHFYRTTRLCMKLIEAELGKRTEAVIEAALKEAEEQSIDRLATAIARFLPLVDVPDA